MRRKNKVLLVAAIAMAVAAYGGAIWYGWHVLTTWRAVRALPWSASDVREYYQDSGFPLYDYFHYVKARMPESEFPAYAARLGLRPLAQHERVAIWNSGEPGWWDPSSSLEGTHVRLDAPDGGTKAKWENGHVYVEAWQN